MAEVIDPRSPFAASRETISYQRNGVDARNSLRGLGVSVIGRLPERLVWLERQWANKRSKRCAEGKGRYLFEALPLLFLSFHRLALRRPSFSSSNAACCRRRLGFCLSESLPPAPSSLHLSDHCGRKIHPRLLLLRTTAAHLTLLLMMIFPSMAPHGCFPCFLLLRLLSFSILIISFMKGPPTASAFTGTYGINYGRIADNLPPPESVVTLLKAARIKNVRIYDADHSVLQAFKGSGLELTVGLGNEFLKDMSVSEDKAMNWIKENVQQYLPDTHIVGIAIGNEVLGGADVELYEALYGAVKNIYTALTRLELSDKVEVNTPHSQAVFANSYPPSSCTFKDNLLPYMRPILDFFSQTGAPFYVNVYPFLAYNSDPEHIDIKYALFQPNPGIYDEKTHLHYDNMFDAQVDAAYAALAGAGYDKMEVVVSETGWASHGDSDEAGASVENARAYNSNLRKRLLKKKGTPFRPKRVVRAYIFALFNEDLKPGKLSERYYGLFKADGSISYDIGFTGLRPSSASLSVMSIKDMKIFSWPGQYGIVVITCTAAMLLLLFS